MSITAQKTILDNGIRVLTEQMPGLRSVSVGVICDVGPKDELPDERGYAHLIEHMLFQGTGERSARSIAEMMEIGGGAMGAFTARDYTVYHATVLDDYLPFALEVLGDMVCNSILADDAIERQRSVILHEMAGHDDPLTLTNNLLKANLWPDHALGQPTIGFESTIQAANRESLLRFMSRNYIAERMIVGAAGNVDHDSFVSQVQDSFRLMPGASQVQPIQEPPATRHGVIAAYPRDLKQVYFSIAWPAPTYASPERYAWHVLSALYGGGAASALYQSLREDRGMAYHIESQYHAYGSGGALVVEGATNPQTLLPVVAGTLVELMRLSEEAIDPDRYHHVVQSLVSQHLVSGDSAYVRMSRLGVQELYFHQPLLSQDVANEIHSQSPENIQTIASQILNSGLPTIGLVGPIDENHLAQIEEMLADFGEIEAVGLVTEDNLIVRPINLGIPAMNNGFYSNKEVEHAPGSTHQA